MFPTWGVQRHQRRGRRSTMEVSESFRYMDVLLCLHIQESSFCMELKFFSWSIWGSLYIPQILFVQLI